MKYFNAKKFDIASSEFQRLVIEHMASNMFPSIETFNQEEANKKIDKSYLEDDIIHVP